MLKWNVLLLSMALCTGAQAAEGLVKESQKGNLIFYKGTITISGEFSRYTDEESLNVMGDVLCFEATGVSVKAIPRTAGDERAPWFCFSNKQKAMQMLKVPATKAPKGKCGYSGEATITVTRYIADIEPTETSDMAQLVSVVSSKPAKPLDCVE